MLEQSDLVGASSTRPWPAERIERWAIDKLIPYADNARLHIETDIDKLASRFAGGDGPTRCWSMKTAC
jgi:hypothetical protein